jgi:hypothetical protein
MSYAVPVQDGCKRIINKHRVNAMKKRHALFVILLSPCFAPALLLSDSAPVMPVQSGTVKPIRSGDVRLCDERIDIDLYEDYYTVRVDYNFKNEGGAQPVSMGFPNVSGSYMLAPITDFEAFEGKKKLKSYRKNDDSSKDEYQRKFFECFDLSFAAGEKKNIVNTYRSGYVRDYDGTHRSLTYILKTGALWKGTIDSVMAYIHLNNFTIEDMAGRTGYCYLDKKLNTVSYGPLTIAPSRYSHNKKTNTLEMKFTDVEPDFDIDVSFPPRMIWHAEATSCLVSKKYDYSPDKAGDGDPATAWVEGKGDDGIGESITVTFAPTMAGGKIQGYYYVSKIGVINGLAANDELFEKNNRVKRARLEYVRSGQESGHEDVITKQVVDLRDTREMQYITLEKPVPMSSLKFTILDVYRGTRFRDTCVSEIKIFTVKSPAGK